MQYDKGNADVQKCAVDLKKGKVNNFITFESFRNNIVPIEYPIL